jgi:hypothetical protein
MPRDVTGRIGHRYYEPQYFGRNLVVALPSTVHGHLWDPRQIDVLLTQRQVIAIEEHIAPVRPDGLVQTPNIVDDVADLCRLYEYLRGQNVWHATGTEIASYAMARERSLICDVTRDGFAIRYDGCTERPLLTLWIDSAVLGTRAAALEVVTPDGVTIGSTASSSAPLTHRHRVTVPVTSGRYHVRPSLAQQGSV